MTELLRDKAVPHDNKHILPFLVALCMFLSIVEYAIPKPLPFLRIGLANLPIMLSLAILPWRKVLLLSVLKILVQAFLSGTLFSYIFIFSAAGSMSSSLAMIALYHLGGRPKSTSAEDDRGKHISLIGISSGGALANNIAQLAVSYLFIFKSNTFYIAPLLLSCGLVTGFLLGLFARLFAARSLWYRKMLGEGK